jgi:hypothetical protein
VEENSSGKETPPKSNPVLQEELKKLIGEAFLQTKITRE